MQTSTNPFSHSAIMDTRNILKKEEREKAFLKRYGKSVKFEVSYDTNPDGTLKEITQIVTSRGHQYKLAEYLDNGATEKAILTYFHGERTINNEFKRFLDAEVGLADLISQEV